MCRPRCFTGHPSRASGSHGSGEGSRFVGSISSWYAGTNQIAHGLMLERWQGKKKFCDNFVHLPTLRFWRMILCCRSGSVSLDSPSGEMQSEGNWRIRKNPGNSIARLPRTIRVSAIRVAKSNVPPFAFSRCLFFFYLLPLSLLYCTD